MNCKEAIDWVDAYVDDELELSRRLDFDAHAKTCIACAQKLKQRRALRSAFVDSSLRYEAPPTLVNAVQAYSENPSPGHRTGEGGRRPDEGTSLPMGPHPDPRATYASARGSAIGPATHRTDGLPP